ncbi:MAG: DUF2029 domain-containing protein [Scytolyngbya sp. HA4215-MV1]|jgi:hypothetical protein|nr:DUF2029 domain-containing protein [Scytolyngbya sp. HA4215-MV1]
MKNFIKDWDQLKPLTKNLVLFAVVNIVLINIIFIAGLLMFLFSTVWQEVRLYKTWEDVGIFHTIGKFFIFHQGPDSWLPMKNALRLHQKGVPIYDIFFKNNIKFQYPPSSLLISMVLRRLWYLNILSWLSVVVSLVFSFKIFEFVLKDNQSDNANNYSRKDRRIIAVALIALGLTFYPIMKGYSLGQVQTLLNGLFAVTLWLWITGKKQLAGICLGIMCLIKPQYALILIWGIVRRQWKFVVPFLLTFGLGMLLSIGIFGLANHLDYLKVLSFISKRGEALYANQSVNGLLHRLLFNGNNLAWESKKFPPYNPWVYFGTLMTSLTFLVTALLPVKKKDPAAFIDFSLIVLTATIASPIAWEHHYGILLPIYAALLPHLLENPIFGKFTLPYLAISYVLCSNFFKFTNLLAFVPVLNILQSYLLIGSLMVLICLHWLKNKPWVPPLNREFL